MNKLYQRINWENEPSILTPLNATNLNKIDYAVDELDSRIVNLDASKAQQSDLLTSLKTVSYNSNTGIFTFTWNNGSTLQVDLNVEKIPVSFSMSPDGIITMTTADGTKYTCDVAELIKAYIFESEQIDFVKTTKQDGSFLVTATIKAGSITEDMLESNLLGKIDNAKGYSEAALQSSKDSAASADSSEESSLLSKSYAVGGTGIREGEDTDNAKYYKDLASAITNVDIATVDRVGIVKPDGDTITIDEDGTLHGSAGGAEIFVEYDQSLAGATVTLTHLPSAESEREEIYSFVVEPGTTQKRIDVKSLGLWTISEDMYNSSVELDIKYYGYYNVSVGGDIFINVTVDMEFEGEKIYIKNGSKILSRTATESGVQFCVNDEGIWEVYLEYDNHTFKQNIPTTHGNTYNVHLSYNSATIAIFADAKTFGGKQIEVLYNGEPYKTAWFNITGVANIVVYDLGLYTLNCEDTSVEVNIDYFRVYEVEFASYNYKKWLELGRVTKSFSSLADVLADQTTLRQLMTIHASADYMLEWLQNDEAFRNALLGSDNALKWIGLRDYTYDKLPSDFISEWLSGQYWERALKDHVPVMTSNTAPYGNTVEKDHYQSYVSSNAFDNSDSTYWSANSNNSFVGYCFTNPICVNAISVKQRLGRVSDFEVIVSDNGSTWKQIYRGNLNNSNNLTKFKFSNNEYHRYWAFRDITTSDFMCIDTLQFYGRSLNVSVPVMTSNTEPYGQVEWTTTATSYDGWKAFDGSEEDGHNFNGIITPAWISYKFTTPVCIKEIYVSDKALNRIKTYKLQGRNDGVDWVDLTDVIAHSDTERYTTINNNNNYLYYRLFVTSYVGTAAIFGLQFYGVDYSEREFEEGSTIKYLYDHGVELEPIIDVVNSGKAEKKTDYLYVEQNTDYISVNGFRTTNKIELSGKNLFRAILGDLYKNGTYNSLMISKDLLYVSESTLASNNFNNIPNNLSLDILSVNQPAYPTIYVAGSELPYMSVKELWLE